MNHHDFDLSAVLEQLRSDESGDLVHQMVAFLYQALIDAEATEVVQAERHERTLARTTQRNGTRPRLLTTRAGDVELKIPKLRVNDSFLTDIAHWISRDPTISSLGHIEGEETIVLEIRTWVGRRLTMQESNSKSSLTWNY